MTFLKKFKKVQLTLVGSQYALCNEPKMIILRCP